MMRLGICLSGGGARGVAHLGVLKALQEMDIRPEVISGVSSGAIAGAFLAAGFSPDEILQKVCDLPLSRFLKPSLNRGIIHSKALRTIFEDHLVGLTFESFSTKLIISALDLVEGITVYHTTGSVIDALIASSSVPILFNPYKDGNSLLVDGGLVNNMPVECLQGECDTIIGVHVNPIHHQAELKSIKDITERVFHLALNENVRHRAPLCDFYIEPPQLKEYHVYSLNKAREIFAVGYEYTLSLAEELTLFKTSLP